MNWGWFVHLGAVGLVAVAIMDQSFVPIPGGIDMMLILLAAGHPDQWLLYWLVAVAGALLGAWITYRISKKGGKEALVKRLPRKRVEKVERGFERHGFWALFVAGLMPPPMPLVPVLVGAGALQYPTRKFLLSLGASRAIRYAIVAWLAHTYGKGIMRVFTAHKWAVAISFLAFSAGAGLIGFLWTRHEMRKERAERHRTEQAA